MTPQKKAKELLSKFRSHAQYWDCNNDAPVEKDQAAQCALICVQELIEITGSKYWYDVKKHISKYIK
tara:strand:- start:724 stop:924 length:201 start_codon:yes stop_codon:yes gene_type:complete